MVCEAEGNHVAWLDTVCQERIVYEHLRKLGRRQQCPEACYGFSVMIVTGPFDLGYTQDFVQCFVAVLVTAMRHLIGGNSRIRLIGQLSNHDFPHPNFGQMSRNQLSLGRLLLQLQKRKHSWAIFDIRSEAQERRQLPEPAC